MTAIELDPDDVRVGLSNDTLERKALLLIGARPRKGSWYIYHGSDRKTEYGLLGVCSSSTRPLPHGCWDDAGRSPYALYSGERWCDACIAYAAVQGLLPRPEQQIDGDALGIAILAIDGAR